MLHAGAGGRKLPLWALPPNWFGLKPVAHGETVVSVQQVDSLAKWLASLAKGLVSLAQQRTHETAHFSLFFLTTNTRLF
jgi:hypothetical protein